MSRLLFEIGVEELPVSFLRRALEAIPALAEKALDDLRLEHGAVRAIGTPRRITLTVEGLAERQADLAERVVGPPAAAAFDAEGQAKPAAIGFAKKNGVEVGALVVEETEKGAYVVAERAEPGRPALEVLGGALERLITQLPFPKSMRWGDGELAFGRPIHWLVALLGAEVVPLALVGIRSGRTTRGHRFLSPASFELAEADAYEAALEAAHVLVDPAHRRRAMESHLDAAAAAISAALVPDAFLLEENASLVEEPHVITGSFDESFLRLPEEVIIEVMRGHQRYFALRDREGRLMPRYLAVANTARDPETIAKGNDRVLQARLADAAFFVDEDRATPLAEHAKRLDAVVYQKALGSVGERALRLAEIVRALGDEGAAFEAATICKADLVTLIVGEFPELQGVMGRHYALAEGRAAEVAEAIEGHYAPRGASDAVPTSLAATHLALAERADLLVGCFALGQMPSGSADPYGLRRAALGVVRIALEGPVDVELSALLAAAHAAYAGQGKPVGEAASILSPLDEFFRARLRAFHQERHATDGVDACLAAWSGGSIRDLSLRLEALKAFRREPAFESLAVAFKRAHNIAKDTPEAALSIEALVEPAELALAKSFAELEPRFAAAVDAGDYGAALGLVAAELREPIDRFFEEVFVMVDDLSLREARLRLLGAIARLPATVAHLHLLSS